MSAHSGNPPPALRFTASMETTEPTEAETNDALIETLAKISQTTFEHSGHATRSVHAKSHGVMRGTMTVLDGLPAQLAQGLFAKPGRYDVAMRFSTLPGDILDDSVSTPRGLAVKVIGVQGPRLPGSEGDTTQDFVLVNGPAFAAPTPAKFLANLKMLAATTDKAEGAKKVLSAVARGTETVIEAFGGKSAMVTTMGGQPETNILGETFYSQTPFLYGDHVAKFSVAPVFDLSKLTGASQSTRAVPPTPCGRRLRRISRRMAASGTSASSSARTLSPCRSRTPRWPGPRMQALTSRSRGWRSGRKTRGVRKASRRSTKASRSVPGTAWRPTGPWAG